MIDLIVFVSALPIQQGATVEIVMTDNSKTPSAKKDQAGYQQNGQQAVRPSEGTGNASGGDWLGGPQNGEEATYQQNGQQAVRPSEGTGNVSGDWLGGPQNGEEDDRGRVPADDIKEKKAPKGSLSGGVDEQQGGGPDV
ncbi:hypothetical protein E0H56_27735 [Rhizobium leguminosarum bv. viciae]|uniref:hypothetical protein n=1 Tax=Rhizobium leguminosarum TaxID=384 RepID=UPI00103D7CB0|nr:hypothetical protein [Rhizobium leguminosarum]MBY5530528.1 hypothetical protein [Rhizobium leguminosarum]TBZ86144.1 hypothetical protein E0H56_27735 [Rhizobium leguminosarum bv. viciae]